LDNSAKNITALQEHGQKIGSVLDVIKCIADQTKLLALNAAIETVRAEEQARGFSVASDEVNYMMIPIASAAEELVAVVQEINPKLQSVNDFLGQNIDSSAQVSMTSE
jgi:methyl-accepting chemotaxis protein